MSTSSQELMLAIAAVAPEVIGRKKLRRLLFAVHRELATKVDDNVIGPVAGARRDAAQLLESAMRRCLLAKMERG